MAKYVDIENLEGNELRLAAVRAAAQGYGAIMVPFSGANSGPFDALVSEGIAKSYRLLIEIDLVRDEVPQ